MILCDASCTTIFQSLFFKKYKPTTNFIKLCKLGFTGEQVLMFYLSKDFPNFFLQKASFKEIKITLTSPTRFLKNYNKKA